MTHALTSNESSIAATDAAGPGYAPTDEAQFGGPEGADDGCRKHDTAIIDSRVVSDFPTHWDVIPDVQSHVVATLQRYGFCTEGHEEMHVCLALQEALANAVYHGNLEISSQLKQEDDNQFYDLARCRVAEQPYRSRRIRLIEEICPDEIRITISDEGPGFDVLKVADPGDGENLDKPSGRGLQMMRAFMDDVVHNATGTSVTLIKRRGSLEAKDRSARRDETSN